jgi:thiamine kinase-like enzyme
MEWLDKMNNAIDYIEANIIEKVDYLQAANIACCSLSRFQNMFLFITDITPAEYVRRRRMALSAYELINNNVKSLSEKFKTMNFDMTLCHMDAHGYNLMQSERLVLVDWEMAKYAPPELDLILFTKPGYWDTFIKHYNKLRPNFVLDNDLLMFYVHRRNIEDIWEYINTILNDRQTNEQRQVELGLLKVCCDALNDSFNELSRNSPRYLRQS